MIYFSEPLLSYESPKQQTDQLYNQHYRENISQYKPMDQSLSRTTVLRFIFICYKLILIID